MNLIVEFYENSLISKSERIKELITEKSEALLEAEAQINDVILKHLNTMTKLNNLRSAVQNLLDDVHKRYPGEELKCPFMIALEKELKESNIQENKKLLEEDREITMREFGSICHEQLQIGKEE